MNGFLLAFKLRDLGLIGNLIFGGGPKRYCACMLRFFCLIVLLVPLACSAKLALTSDERAFIETHPVLRYSILPDAPPFEFLDKDGHPRGAVSGYVTILSRETGIHFECIPAKNHQQKIENLLSGRCDFLVGYSPQASPPATFPRTEPWATISLVLVTRLDNPSIHSLSDCRGQTVGMTQRLGMLDQLRKNHPGVTFTECRTLELGLEKVAHGQLFGVVGPLSGVAYAIQERKSLGNLKISGKLKENLPISTVVRPEDEPFRNILNKIFRSIDPDTKNRLLNRWISIRFEQGFDYRLFWKILAGTAVVVSLIVLRYRSVARYNRKLRELNGELAKSLEERDRIMAVISHDLRQPIQGMGTFLELLEEGTVDPASEQGRTMVHQTRARSERVYESLENLLGWLNVRNRVPQPRFEYLPLCHVVEDALVFLHTFIRDKDVRVDNQVPVGVQVEADERMLSAILRNLIANAVKFSSAGGVVTVVAETGPDGCRVQVIDHGMGMTPERIEEILQDRVVSIAGTGGEKGAGLGLQLCRSFLAAMESELEIESVPGQGSVFSFGLKAGE